MPGRPLRFLATVLGGWAALRVFMLWPGQVPTAVRAMGEAEARSAENAVARTAARIGAAVISPGRAQALAAPPTAGGGAARFPISRQSEAQTATPRRSDFAPRPTDARSLARDGFAQSPAETVPARGTTVQSAVIPAQQPGDSVVLFPFSSRDQAVMSARKHAADRWSASAYALVRPGDGAAGALTTPQLAGSQVAARVAYALGERGRVALVARAAAALGVRQQEAAVGVEWQPTSAPVRLVAEQRVGIAGIGSGPGVGAVGGGAVPLGGEARAEGYVQAGYVARDRGTGYVDGAARVVAPPRRLGTLRLELGVAVWGAAQRDASRLDVGPSAALVVPVAGKALRFSLDWRERIAGEARPGSGPALTLGSDF